MLSIATKARRGYELTPVQKIRFMIKDTGEIFEEKLEKEKTKHLQKKQEVRSTDQRHDSDSSKHPHSEVNDVSELVGLLN